MFGLYNEIMIQSTNQNTLFDFILINKTNEMTNLQFRLKPN